MKEQFWLLKPEEQRVAIAQDVIKQLDSKFLVASRGIYLDLPRGIKVEEGKLDVIFENMKTNNNHCDVCAIGACFMSIVLLGDKMEVKDVVHSWINDENQQVVNVPIFGIDSAIIKDQLAKVFSREQLYLIESAFEIARYPHKNITRDEIERAVDFGRKYLYSSDERLYAIMNNIIENKGEFIP